MVARSTLSEANESVTDNGDGTYSRETITKNSTPSGASTAAASRSQTAVAGGSLAAKGSPGNFYGFNVVAGASAGFVMLFDSVAVPGDGTVTPLRVWVVAANAERSVEFTKPVRCNSGIVLVFSTTGPFTKTISATAFMACDYV